MRSQIFPHKVGLSLRPAHYPHLEHRPRTEAAWFEATTESYLDSRGRPLEMLSLIRQDYPLALHGTSLNLGNPEGLDPGYLNKLRDLVEQTEPFMVSDHICWTGDSYHNMHDLLPLPFTQESLQCLVENVDFVQSTLRRALVLENISSLVSYRDDEMREWEFISELSRRSGCALIVDLGNLFDNSRRVGFSPREYLEGLPWERVAEIHVASPTVITTEPLPLLNDEIPEEIWNLFRGLAPHIRHLPVCIERNDLVPDFKDLEFDILKAAFIMENTHEAQRSSIHV